MYTISDEQVKELQGWIDKIPESIVKYQIATLFENISPANRITSEQLEKFLSYQNALPTEFQTYPQTFAQVLKNPDLIKADVLAASHSHVKDESKQAEKGKGDGKPPAQKVEEKRIMAANKAVDEPKEKIVQKPQVVVIDKSKLNKK